ncbi:MAG: hypothetical protein R3308_06925 [Thiohalobacterales bacterium]|nr:hypothetical protein [Thiohalobacterales bacterium]
MRYLIYLLLLANAAYLGWNLLQEESASPSVRQVPSVPAGVRPLVTLKEHTEGMTSGNEAAGLNALTAAQPPAASGAMNCRALGPFTVLREAEAMVARLDKRELDPVLRSVEGRVENGFMVFKQARDREDSRGIVQRLKSNDDTDYYVGKDYLVYLGAFDTLERATLRLEEVREIGLDAAVRERYKTRQEYWLEVPERAAASEQLEAITMDNPRLQLHTLSCL